MQPLHKPLQHQDSILVYTWNRFSCQVYNPHIPCLHTLSHGEMTGLHRNLLGCSRGGCMYPQLSMDSQLLQLALCLSRGHTFDKVCSCFCIQYSLVPDTVLQARWGKCSKCRRQTLVGDHSR